MLWIKAFHVIFVVTWFAGLFYLPRLFVYHCEVTSEPEHERFCTMERRLYRITELGGMLAIGFGLWMLFQMPGLMHAGWLHVKLLLVAGLIVYHFWLRSLMNAFARGENRHSARFFRIINEIPAVVLIAVVCLAVLKPF